MKINNEVGVSEKVSLGGYSIGLDIGVASVGWACMTSDYRIPKFNGRYAIGVREFEAGQTAEAARLQRGTRRRYNRRIKRIQLLQKVISPLFSDDPGYFIGFEEKEKHYWKNSNKFENNSLSETLAHIGLNTKKYPTIYHLRKSLITKEKKTHPSLIYLALHNLIKYRGHFLNENMNWLESKNSESLEKLLVEYFKELVNHQYKELEIAQLDFERMISLMNDSNMTMADKRKYILGIIGKEYREPITLLIGLKSNISKLFPESDQNSLYKQDKLSISFSEDNILDTIDQLTDDERHVVEQANKIYQTILLKDLLGEAYFVAEAKVRDYDQFGVDLKILKEIFNKHLKVQDYHEMFITSKENIKKYKETRDIKLLCKFDKFLKVHKEEDNFYKQLKIKLEKINKESITQEELNMITDIINAIDNQQFLRKLKSKDNGSIPYQNNVYEAETILKNQQKFYPEITDEMITKIKDIISFRIPYYIGPLVKGDKPDKFGWISRKTEGDNVTPWNFYDIINRSQSAENFINRMTSYCTYLINEKVLPKYSLMYQKFELLNELNSLQIRSSHELPNKKYRLSMEEKQWIIDNVFSKQKSISHKRLKDLLKISPYKHLIIDENTESLKNIYGTQQDNKFTSSLSAWIDMTNIFGSLDNVDNAMLEEIIYWITVFEEKDIIEMKIKEKYPTINKNQIRSLVNLNYSGWGKLSKRFIDELPADEYKQLTILDVMEEESKVFMEVLSTEKYNLNERIANINLKSDEQYTKVKYQDISELHGSPAIKKGIWQAILIIEELVSIFGEPENIMIEFAREEGIKQRTTKRKDKIKEVLRNLNANEKELKDFLREHSSYKDSRYRDERLYLYITQQGKCLYSGERLNVEELYLYEVDHILPRSFVKDDSIDNLALVKSTMNQLKGYNKMPLEILTENQKIKQKVFWKKLHDNKMISQLKYNRLLKDSFSDQDKEGFFARQLVETRQITKHVKDILNERFKDTEIHTVNANIVTNLRKHSNIQKLRNLNNKHHAIDAALTVIVIQFIINQYGVNFLNFNFKYQEAQKKWREMLTKYKKNFFLFSDIDKHEKFVHFQTGELLSGREFLNVLNDEMPWQTTKKIGTSEAAFYDQTLYSPNAVKGRNPQYKSSKLAKGVHSDLKRDCSYLISYEYLDNRERRKIDSKIVDLLVIEKYQTKNISKNELALFLARKIVKGKVIKAKIHTKILKHQLITINNHPLYFVSAGEMNNAKQFRPKEDVVKKLYKIIANKEDISKDFLKETFIELTQDAIHQYKTYLPESRIKAIKEYVEIVVDIESFNKGVEELMKMTSASAARSTIFGGRYERKLNPKEAKFIHQSITGLNYRKPKSYKNELWSK